MKTALRMAALLVAAPLLSTGCSVTTRYITTEGWAGTEVMYLAHVESTQSLFSAEHNAKVSRCLRREDNSLDCVEQAALNDVLNKKE
jgi:hypothetical protein